MLQMIISCLADYGILLWFNQRYKFKNPEKIRIVLMLLLMIIVVYTSNTVGILSPAGRVAITVGYYLIAVWLLYKDMRLWQCLIRTGTLLVHIILSEFLVMAIALIGADETTYATIMDSNMYWLLILSSSKCCEIIFLNLTNKIWFKKMEGFSGKELLWHGLFLGSIFVYLYMMVQAGYQNAMGIDVLERTFWINCAFIILGFAGYYFYWKMYEERDRQKQIIKHLQQKQEMQMDYYKQAIYYETELRKIKHNMKNQLLILKSVGNHENVEKYENEIEKMFPENDIELKTGNEILDILLKQKISYCKEHNIEFAYNVNFRRGQFIDLIDVGVIFGNILDNAIEACERMKSEYRKIDLMVYESGEFIMIKLSNSFDEIKLVNKKIVSLKGDDVNHGLGLKILQNTLDKYDGNYRYDIQDGEFKLNILIPIKEIL